MEAELVSRAMAAATAVAGALGLPVDDACVIHNSNKLALRLLPCDVFARVAPLGQEVAALEVELAQRLAAVASPVAALEPRVEPGVYERDSFAVSLWTYHEAIPDPYSPADYADALQRLHAGMRGVEVATPHFMERVAAAQRLVRTRHENPALSEGDRHLLLDTLRSAGQQIRSRGAAEQLLHGEPHSGNLLSTQGGLLFIDLETCAVGPSSSMLRTCLTRSAHTTQMLIEFCFRSVAGLYLRWSLPGAGTSAMNSRMGTNTVETS